MRQTIIDDAFKQAGSIYSLNARGAQWYAFCHDGYNLVSGEFVWVSEGRPHPDVFDACIDLQTGEMTIFFRKEEEVTDG